jgi:serine/threonine protein kinase
LAIIGARPLKFRAVPVQLSLMRAGDELGEYTIIGVLSPGRSWLARAGGRDVVLKILEEDCLLAGKLHPSIAERLSRVRELPQRYVANLHGVETDHDTTFLVWDYVPGVSLRQAIESGASLKRMARELLLAVDALHARGIVHGRIHEGNVIVDDRSRVWLIDISPLLFSDAREDATGALALLRQSADEFADAEMQERLRSLDECDVTIAELERRLTHREAVMENPESHPFDAVRLRSLLWAALALAAGIAIALAVPWNTTRSTTQPATMDLGNRE